MSDTIRDALAEAIRRAINTNSAENASNTPDYILAQFMCACLVAFDTATQQRETWYGRDARPSSAALAAPPAPIPRGESITFDALVAHGLANGANVVNGMPWSWNFYGIPVTHENDNCYLLCTTAGVVRVERPTAEPPAGVPRQCGACGHYEQERCYCEACGWKWPSAAPNDQPGGTAANATLHAQPDHAGTASPPDPIAAPAQGEPQGTHWDGCATEGGPRHYECAVREIERLRDAPPAPSVPREPTKAMLNAAFPINNCDSQNLNVWRAMYDTASNDQPG